MMSRHLKRSFRVTRAKVRRRCEAGPHPGYVTLELWLRNPGAGREVVGYGHLVPLDAERIDRLRGVLDPVDLVPAPERREVDHAHAARRSESDDQSITDEEHGGS